MQGIITDIQRFSVHDGPGIRTTVFLKGCNLRCAWCHNPETLRPGPQLQVLPDKCIGCDACLEACPRDAHEVTEGRRVFHRDRCTACGACAEVCYSGALVLIGRETTADEVMAEVLEDRVFYENSGGGVTLSGGEPLCQGAFALDILCRARAEGIHTAVETNLAAPWQDVAALLYEYGAEKGYPYSHLAIKAALLNSASKHVRDHGGVVWPDSPAAAYTWVGHWGGALRSTQPLDYAMGAGQLNGLAAVRQMQGGGRTDIGLRYIDPMSAGDTAVYSLADGAMLKRGSLVEATVVWDRPVVQEEGTKGTDPDHYTVTPLPDIDLRLYRTEPTGGRDLVAYSASSYDNVEHIYFNIHDDGQYQLEVIHYDGAPVEQAAVAWTAGSSEGLAFSVDGGGFGSRRMSVTQNPAEGQPVDRSFPNDVNSLGTQGPGHFPTEGEVFTSDQSGTNQQRFSGALGTRARVGPHNASPAGMAVLDSGSRGVLGLRDKDNVVGLSWGTDGTALCPTVLAFSVDPDAQGVPGVPVYSQAAADEAAGDIYLSADYRPFGAYFSPYEPPQGPHRLEVDEADLGLAAPAGMNGEDDLDALELTPPVDGDRYGPVADPDGDGMPNIAVFFTLDAYSPSANGVGGNTPDDIFVADPQDPSDGFDLMPSAPFIFRIFAEGPSMGLKSWDRISSLALSDVTPSPTDKNPYRRINKGNAQLDRGFDQALFTLASSPGAIYFTDFMGGYVEFASNTSLGLGPDDKVNALDVLHSWHVPPPWAPPTVGPPPPITPKKWLTTVTDPTYAILTPSALLPSGVVITEEVMVEPWAAYGLADEEVDVRVEGWVTGDATVQANVGAVDFIYVPDADTPVLPSAVKVPGMFWIADPNTFDLGQIVELESGELADLTFTPMGSSFELRLCYEMPSLSEDESLLHLLNITGEMNPDLGLVFQKVEFDLFGPEAFVQFEMTLFPDFYDPGKTGASAFTESMDPETLLFTLKFSGLTLVPEPATLALVTLGGMGMLLRRRRRRRR